MILWTYITIHLFSNLLVSFPTETILYFSSALFPSLLLAVVTRTAHNGFEQRHNLFHFFF